MPVLSALEHIYGEAAEVQQARYSAALAAFARVYGPGPIHVFRAPGRVNLIGEHTDYNHGFVLPVPLDHDMLLLARPRPDGTVRLHNIEPDFAPRTFAIGPTITPASKGDWSNYVRGAAQMVARHISPSPPVYDPPAPPVYGGANVRGMDALVDAAPPYGIPRGAGLSSSSALTVVAALALAHFNGWQPDPVPFARMCSEAEWYVGTRGGIMDQFIALLARPGHALFLDCRPQTPPRPSRPPSVPPNFGGEGGGGSPWYTFAHIPLPLNHRFLVADTGVRHTNVRGEYNLRVAACRAGMACLCPRYPGITHLRDVQGVAWAELAALLPEVLTVAEARAHFDRADLDDVPLPTDEAELRVRACCRHVHSENERVRAAVAALEAGDITTVGHLLNLAHASARDDYDISCPELEVLVEAARGVEGTAGARLTGAGWGGCIVALVRQEAVPDFTTEVPRRYREQTGREPAIFVCRARGGAGLVFPQLASE
ncbi:MAG: galactokinase [Chloroflexi bacterium]|nr:galactokinase [Chloroflexota bacterium]